MSISVQQEAAIVVSLQPTEKELEQIADAIQTVLAGLRKDRRGWHLDPSLRRLVGRRDPAVVRRKLMRGQRVLSEVKRILGEARG